MTQDAQAPSRPLRAAWRDLRQDRLFWAFFAAKLVLSACLGSHFASRWFAPFLHDFAAAPLQDPWQRYLDRGELLAFPYGPVMLLGVGLPWLVAAPLGVPGVGALALLLLRLPLLAADVLIAVLLAAWLPRHGKSVARAWWCSPIVLFATYIHGQLDVWPTALLLLSLWFLLSERPRWSAWVLGLGIGAKLHLLVAVPFAITWLWKRRLGRRALPGFVLVLLATVATTYLPVLSPAFSRLVLQSGESARLWAVTVPFGPHISLYLAPMALVLAWVRMATWRTVERELLLLILGLAFVVLVAVVPPQPGWFVWSVPFVAYLGAQFSRTASWSVRAMNTAYLGYFFVAQAELVLESVDPLLGAGTGARWAAKWAAEVPFLATPHAASLAWTLLFCATAWTAWEMIRRGIRAHVSGRHDQVFLLGIGGDSGVGKHTLARDLQAVLADRLALVDGDDDHRWERGDPAWSALTHLDPRANRLDVQVQALQRIRQGGDVRKPRYDHADGRFTRPLLWPDARMVGLVGLHPFYLAAQRRLLDLRVFVDAADDVRTARKIARDTADRGKSEAHVRAELERREPDAERFVRPQRQHADLVVVHTSAVVNDQVAMNVELAGHLDPFALLAALTATGTLQVAWQPDPTLQRETLSVTGTLSASQAQGLARQLHPDAGDWLEDGDSPWLGGQRGLGQVVLVHAASAAWLTPDAERRGA